MWLGAVAQAKPAYSLHQNCFHKEKKKGHGYRRLTSEEKRRPSMQPGLTSQGSLLPPWNPG